MHPDRARLPCAQEVVAGSHHHSTSSLCPTLTGFQVLGTDTMRPQSLAQRSSGLFRGTDPKGAHCSVTCEA